MLLQNSEAKVTPWSLDADIDEDGIDVGGNRKVQKRKKRVAGGTMN